MQKLKSAFQAVFSGNATNRQFIDVFGALLIVSAVVGLLLYLVV